MENKKNYYENDSRDMQDFNPRFNDLYQGYSHSQQENHTFNLNGTLYVHNHHGGEPIPVGKVKTPTGSRSTAKSQRGQKQVRGLGVNQASVGTAAVQRTRANRSGINDSGANRHQGQRNRWNQANGKTAGQVVRGVIALFIISMIVSVVLVLTNLDFGKDSDFSEDDMDTYESRYTVERENPSLEELITEEGVVYLMGGYIQMGATADTLWETYDMPEFLPQEPVQPGENYYISLDLGEKYGVASVGLKNIGDAATQDFNKFVITQVCADYYTEFGDDYETIRTETDCEIIEGITIGMDYTEALWALSEVCDNPQIVDSLEGNQGHLVGCSEEYYYSITVEDEEISSIAVSLRETE